MVQTQPQSPKTTSAIFSHHAKYQIAFLVSSQYLWVSVATFHKFSLQTMKYWIDTIFCIYLAAIKAFDNTLILNSIPLGFALSLSKGEFVLHEESFNALRQAQDVGFDKSFFVSSQ